MTFVDRVLTCRECGAEFVFSAGEQEFYQERGLLHDPARCPGCRAARRQRQGPGRAAAGARQGPREMYPAVCAECGEATQVPFEPRQDKPVYCDTCFERVRQARQSGPAAGT